MNSQVTCLRGNFKLGVRDISPGVATFMRIPLRTSAYASAAHYLNSSILALNLFKLPDLFLGFSIEHSADESETRSYQDQGDADAKNFLQAHA